MEKLPGPGDFPNLDFITAAANSAGVIALLSLYGFVRKAWKVCFSEVILYALAQSLVWYRGVAWRFKLYRNILVIIEA